MFGKKLNENVTAELERRKRALNRLDYHNDFGQERTPSSPTTGVPEYNFSEMMTKTTYARLVSPKYKNKKGTLLEVKGRLLASTALGIKPEEDFQAGKNFENEYWNTTGDKRGYVPPPGITSIRTSYAGEGATINTIKEADITLRLYSLDQYNIIVPYFVRIGTMLYLEYGWTNPKLELDKQQAYPRNFLKVELEDGEPVVKMDLEQVQQFPDEFAVNTRGNSDLFVGTVTNYDAKMMEDGGFEINISLKTTGHSMYHSPTYADSRTNIKIATDGVDEEGNQRDGDKFKHNMDERSAPIMMAKAKLLIQEDFGIKDALTTSFGKQLFQVGVEGEVNFESPSFIYVPMAGPNYNNLVKKYTNVVTKLESKGFIVRGDTRNPYSLIAIHKETSDLIITMTYCGETEVTRTTYEVDSKTGKKEDGSDDTSDRTFMSWKLNYYPSVRYIEDGLLSRLFGIVNEKSGTITAGIRSLYIPKGVDYSLPIDVFKSNKMLTHEFLIPKNFNQVLISSDAMSSVLQRGTTGMFKSDTPAAEDSGWDQDRYAKFTKDLGQLLYKFGLPFIDKSDEAKASIESDDEIKNPKHVPALMRHMYVNIEVVQEAFLGSQNIDFFNRNYFPTSGDDRNQYIDRDIGNDDVYVYFQDKEVKFHKSACVKTLREGLYNMWNQIASNFHNFPNFEVGANIHLPNFLQVYDLRFTKSNEYYEFDVFNKDSIIKSLEFNSKVPTTVQLAATFGASTDFDFDSLLGGNEGGLKEELAMDLLQNKEIVKPTNYSNIIGAVSFEESGYVTSQKILSPGILYQGGSAIGTTENTTGLTQGIAANTVQMLDPETGEVIDIAALNEVKEDEQDWRRRGTNDELGEREGIKNSKTIKNLTLKAGKGTSYPFMGISPVIIAGSVESIEDANPDAEERIRKLYPSLNAQFAQLGDTLTDIFRIDKKGKIKTDNSDTEIEVFNEDTGETEKRKVSVNLESGAIAGLVSVDEEGDPLLSFTTTYGTISSDVAGQRGNQILEFGTHGDYQAYLDYLIYQDEKQSLTALNGTVSYFELTFTIDGISGILPGEAFTISYLPDLIKDYFYFIVKNIEQECTSDGWTTTITALQRRKYSKVKDRKTLVIGINKYKKEEKKKKTPVIDVKAELPPIDNRDPVPAQPDPAPAGTDDDQNTDIVYPPVARPSIPVPTDDEDIADDVTLDKLEFDDFDFDDPPPVMPFIPYEISDSPQAEIVLSWTDGKASIKTTPGPDEQQFLKVYPKGNKNNSPIAFTLGVTDILSETEYNNIIDTYEKSFKVGQGDIRESLKQMYGEFTIEGPPRDGDDANYGKWDTQPGVKFYVANRNIGGDSDFTVGQYIEQMIEESQVIGNDVEANPNDQNPSPNFYVDDILHRILEQPQRTRLTVIEHIEPDIEEEEVKVEESEPIIPEDNKPIEPVVNPVVVAPADPEPEPIASTPIPEPEPEPVMSTYQSYRMSKSQKLKQNSAYLYRVWGDMDGWRVETGNPAKLIKTKSFYGEAVEDAVNFKYRQDFWNQMIEAPNPGGITDERVVQERVKKLVQSGEFKNPKPNQNWVAELEIPKDYDKANDRAAKAYARENDFYNKGLAGFKPFKAK